MPSVKVTLYGDADALKRTYKSAEEASKQFGVKTKETTAHVAGLDKSMKSAHESATSFAKSMLYAGGALVGVGSLYEGLKKTVEVAESFNQAQRQMDAQLRANGESLKAVQPWVDKLQKSQVQLGFTSTQTEKAFTQLDRASGSAAVAYKYMGVTADLAAAKHIDLQKAALLVGKVIDGNTSALNRYGIAVPKDSSAVDALRIAQQKLAGQAAASVTPFDKFHAVLNNIQVLIGNELLPIITKYLDKATAWLSSAKHQKEITDAVKTALHDMGVVLQTAADIFTNNVLPAVRKARDLFKEFSDKVGGTTNALKLLAAGFATWKIASTIAGIGTAASGAVADIKKMRLALLALGGPEVLGALAAVAAAVALARGDKTAPFVGGKSGYQKGSELDDLYRAGQAGKTGKIGIGGGGTINTANLNPTEKRAYNAGLAGFNAATGVGQPTYSAGSGATSAGRKKLLDFAKGAIGTPYLWGGAGPGGFDCSGLVQWAFSNGLNIQIPRSTYGQVAAGRAVGSNTLKGAQPGDVIFTQYGEGGKSGPGHEGLYLGAGQVLSAPHTGALVHTSSLAGFTGVDRNGRPLPYTVRDLTGRAGVSGGGGGGGNGPPGSTALTGDVLAAQAAAAKAQEKAAKEAEKAATAAVKAHEKAAKAAAAAAERERKQQQGLAESAVPAIGDLAAKIAPLRASNAVRAANVAAFLRQQKQDRKALLDSAEGTISGFHLFGIPQASGTANFAPFINKTARPAQTAFTGAQAIIAKLTALSGTDVPGAATDFTKQLQQLLSEQITALQSGIAKLKASGFGSTAQAQKLQSELQGAVGSQQTILQQAVQNARTAYDNAIQSFGSSFDKVATEVDAQFQRQTDEYISNVLGPQFFQGGQTPSEAKLAALQQQNTQQGLQDQLTVALKSGSGLQIRDAREAIEENKLATKATAERAQADSDYAAAVNAYRDEQTKKQGELDDSLGSLKTGIENGSKSMSGLQPILDQFKISMGDKSGATAVAAQFAQDLATATTGEGGIISTLGTLQGAFQTFADYVNNSSGLTASPGAQLSRATLGSLGIPGLASGGVIAASGLAYLHKGETVVPASVGGGGMVSVPLILDGQVIAEALINPLRKTAQVFQRRNARQAF